MNDEENSTRSLLIQRRSKKNRQTKTQLIFDEQARREYLKGFHKRKLERRERAQQELEDEIKSDLKNLRQKRRDEMKRKHEELGLIDPMENLPKKRTIEMKNHTIEIAEIDDQFIAKSGLFMGPNQSQTDAQNDNEDEAAGDDSSNQKPKVKRPLSKKMSLLQNMKAPGAIKKGHHPNKGKIRSSKKLGKNGGVQTPSKKKRTRK